MSGIQEILLIVLLILALLVVPRMLGKRHQKVVPTIRRRPITGTMRLAIIASIAWPAACAAYFQPWDNRWLLFASWGIAPVLGAWSLAWVIRGFRRR